LKPLGRGVRAIIGAMRAWMLASLLLFPGTASALEFTDHSGRFLDEPFAAEEAAGINVLLELGAVDGYPDARFRPEATLNRAEFLKIVIMSHPDAAQRAMEPSRCFPDVSRDDWFSPFVCFVKDWGVVQGYADGLFHPERQVSYAEALKMLTLLYGYEVPPAAEGADWHVPYALAAHARGTDLPEPLAYGSALTRGRMARLAAAFRAASEFKLSRYRAFEEASIPDAEEPLPPTAPGEPLPPADEPALDLPPADAPDFPATSRFLMLGTSTPPIIDGVFRSPADARIRRAFLRLREEEPSIRRVVLTDAQGAEVAVLTRGNADIVDDRYREWTAEITGAAGYHFTKDQDVLVGFRLVLWDRQNGGAPGNIVRVERFYLYAQDDVTGATYQMLPGDPHTPFHQTVQAELRSIANAGPAEGALTEGKGVIVGAFSFSGTILPGALLRVDGLSFRIEQSGVTVTRWMLGRRGAQEKIECAAGGEGTIVVECPSVSATMGSIGTDEPLILELSADVDVRSTDASLRAVIADPGVLGTGGSVRWTDGSGRYNWLDAETDPVAEGTLWR